MPDGFVMPDHGIWPSVALEVGYTEPYERLLSDADLLLEGSEGRIRVVTLVKLQPLGPGETSVQSGFVELHEYDAVSGFRKKRGNKKVWTNSSSLWTILTCFRRCTPCSNPLETSRSH